MDRDAAFQAAVGMCEQGGVKYEVAADNSEIRTLIGSAAVYIRVRGEGALLSYNFVAIFVEDIPADEIDRLEFLEWVNGCNKEMTYGRVFAVDYENDGNPTVDLLVDEEILAASAQQEEFMNSLHAMWFHANRLDDEAVDRFGGKTAWQVITGDDDRGNDAVDV